MSIETLNGSHRSYSSAHGKYHYCVVRVHRVDVLRTLYLQMDAISKMPGPVGPPGYNGSRGLNGSQGPAGPLGPKGAGDFSQCVYKFKGGTAAASGGLARTDVSVNEPRVREFSVQ